MKRLILLVAILALTTSGFSQQLRYDVIRNGERIGFLETNKVQYGGTTTYKVLSEAKVNFLVDVVLAFSFDNTFRDGVLSRAVMTNSQDGKTQEYLELNKGPSS